MPCELNKSAANLYRDREMNILGAGVKVRRLIDQYIISKGIDPTVPPISIMDPEFLDQVIKRKSDQSQASEMEQAARFEINEHFAEDPTYYKKLSVRLEEILKQYADDWEELIRALRPFVHQVRQGRSIDETGLDPQTQAPFLGVLVEEIGEINAKPRMSELAKHTIILVDHIRKEINRLDFWRDPYSQERLLSWIMRFLDYDVDLTTYSVSYEKLPEIASRLVDLARAKRVQLQ